MSLGSFRFNTGVSALFEMATSDARSVLPDHLEPFEVRHQRSILSVTAFLFDDSVVGPYTELMMSVIVPPAVTELSHMAKAAFYPFLGATTSSEARRIKSERFHLPYHDGDIDAQFIETDERLRVRIFGGGAPILDMSVTPGSWGNMTHLIQGFMMNGTERLRASVHITGDYTVHEDEDEGGAMTLYPHPMTSDLLDREVATHPFREHWFKNGSEIFHTLESF